MKFDFLMFSVNLLVKLAYFQSSRGAEVALG